MLVPSKGAAQPAQIMKLMPPGLNELSVPHGRMEKEARRTRAWKVSTLTTAWRVPRSNQPGESLNQTRVEGSYIGTGPRSQEIEPAWIFARQSSLYCEFRSEHGGMRGFWESVGSW